MIVGVGRIKHPNMEFDTVDDPAAHRNSKNPSTDGWFNIMVYFLVRFVYDQIGKPDTEHHRRRQRVELRQCQTNQGRVTKAHIGGKEIEQNQRGVPKKGHKASVQGSAICLKAHESAENSLGLGYSVSVGATCHPGYDLRLKYCACSEGANLNTVDKLAGLNLHFILVILFSTNKLTPDKT